MTITKIQLSILALAFSAVHLDAAVIDVRSNVTARSGLIRLGDVAVIDDANPQMQRQLASVSLGPVPAPGRKLRITQQTIRERLLAHGVNLSEIEFAGQSVAIVESPPEMKADAPPKSAASGPKTVAVKPFAMNPAQRKKAEQVIQEAFHHHYKSSGANVGALNLIVEIPDRDLPQLIGVDASIVRFVEPGLEWGGPQTLTAQFPHPDGSTHIVRMQAWLNETPQVLSLKHAIAKGQVIKDSDLMHVSAKAGESGIEHADAVVGQEATRALRPGAPLQPGDLNKIPLVRNNDLVTVKFRSPGLKVSRLFRASGSGAEGDIVNCVALEDPREKVQVRVTGWHEAEIVAPDRAEDPPTGSTRRYFPAAPEIGACK